jgi:hypothetical protein
VAAVLAANTRRSFNERAGLIDPFGCKRSGAPEAAAMELDPVAFGMTWGAPAGVNEFVTP